jgi:hypothetical protein
VAASAAVVSEAVAAVPGRCRWRSQRSAGHPPSQDMEAAAVPDALVPKRSPSPEMDTAAEARKPSFLGAPLSPEMEAMGAATVDGGCCHARWLVLPGNTDGAAHQQQRCFLWRRVVLPVESGDAATGDCGCYHRGGGASSRAAGCCHR